MVFAQVSTVHISLEAARCRSPILPDAARCKERFCRVRVRSLTVAVRSPCQENDPAGAHPSAHKSVREPPHGLRGCTWMPLVNGTGHSPVSGTADPRSSQTGQVIRGLC